MKKYMMLFCLVGKFELMHSQKIDLSKDEGKFERKEREPNERREQNNEKAQIWFRLQNKK